MEDAPTAIRATGTRAAGTADADASSLNGLCARRQHDMRAVQVPAKFERDFVYDRLVPPGEFWPDSEARVPELSRFGDSSVKHSDEEWTDADDEWLSEDDEPFSCEYELRNRKEFNPETLAGSLQGRWLKSALTHEEMVARATKLDSVKAGRCKRTKRAVTIVDFTRATERLQPWPRTANCALQDAPKPPAISQSLIRQVDL